MAYFSLCFHLPKRTYNEVRSEYEIIISHSFQDINYIQPSLILSYSCHPCTHTASMTFIVLVVHVCPFPLWHRNKVHVHTVYSTTRCKIWLKESQPLGYYWRVTSGNGLTLFSCFPTTLVSMMTFNIFYPSFLPFLSRICNYCLWNLICFNVQKSLACVLMRF